MYAKINEKGLPEVHTKKYICYAGKTVANPSAKTLAEAGYKPLIIPPEPTLSPGETLSISYVDKGDAIECVYSVVEGLKKQGEARKDIL